MCLSYNPFPSCNKFDIIYCSQSGQISQYSMAVYHMTIQLRLTVTSARRYASKENTCNLRDFKRIRRVLHAIQNDLVMVCSIITYYDAYNTSA